MRFPKLVRGPKSALAFVLVSYVLITVALAGATAYAERPDGTHEVLCEPPETGVTGETKFLRPLYAEDSEDPRFVKPASSWGYPPDPLINVNAFTRPGGSGFPKSAPKEQPREPLPLERPVPQPTPADMGLEIANLREEIATMRKEMDEMVRERGREAIFFKTDYGYIGIGKIASGSETVLLAHRRDDLMSSLAIGIDTVQWINKEDGAVYHIPWKSIVGALELKPIGYQNSLAKFTPFEEGDDEVDAQIPELNLPRRGEHPRRPVPKPSDN